MCNVGYGRFVRNVPRSKPIIAWRWWQYGAPDGRKPTREAAARLLPVAIWKTQTWADHIAKADRAPTRTNAFGLHAFATREKAELDNAVPEGWNSAILGSVALWGRVAVCSNGYRAMHARVRSLDHADAANTAEWSLHSSSEENIAKGRRGEKAAKARARRALARAQKQYRVKANPKGRAAK